MSQGQRDEVLSTGASFCSLSWLSLFIGTHWYGVLNRILRLSSNVVVSVFLCELVLGGWVGGSIASTGMLLAAHSNLDTGTKASSEHPVLLPSQAQSGLNTLPQRVLRKELTTPSSLVLMSRSNAQPTGSWDKGERIDLRGLESGEGAGMKMSKDSLNLPVLFVAAAGQDSCGTPNSM